MTCHPTTLRGACRVKPVFIHKDRKSDALVAVSKLVQMVVLFRTTCTKVSQRCSSKYPHCSRVSVPLFPLMRNDSQAWKGKHWSKDRRVIYWCRMGQDVVLAQQTVTAFRGIAKGVRGGACLLNWVKYRDFTKCKWQWTICMTQYIRYAFNVQSEGGIADLLKWCFSNHIVMIIKVFILEYNIWTHSC